MLPIEHHRVGFCCHAIDPIRSSKRPSAKVPSISLSWLAVLALVFAAVSAYYYLRLVMVMYMREPGALTSASPRFVMSPALSIVLACAIAGVVWFGIYPNPLVNLAAQAVLTLK